VDALLGAAGLGDLGDWFPPGDSRHAGAASTSFLDQVMAVLCEGGWSVVNVDTTIVAQEPRLAGERARIRETLAARLAVDVNRVSVKATTPDHLGAVGRTEGIAAQAVVLLRLANRKE
jgi:2-C-methyl-D-erythritol 2,4-cyclodiphosphate synthase